jgi:hypothetical protein
MVGRFEGLSDAAWRVPPAEPEVYLFKLCVSG